MLNRCSEMLKHVRFLCSSMSVSDARPMLNACSENAPNSTNMLRAMQAECLARATDGRTDGLTNMLGAPPEEISLPGNPRGGARPHTPGPSPESTHTTEPPAQAPSEPRRTPARAASASAAPVRLAWTPRRRGWRMDRQRVDATGWRPRRRANRRRLVPVGREAIPMRLRAV